MSGTRNPVLPRLRNRALGAVTAGTLGVLALGASVPAAATTPADDANPDLNVRCGLDIALVLDSSGSIDGFETDVKNAAGAFLGALADTGSGAGTLQFKTGVVLTGDSYVGQFVPVTPSSIAAGGTLGKAIAAYDTPDGGWTNWQDALLETRTGILQDATNRTDVGDLVVFVTDGRPNTIDENNGGNADGTGSAGTNADFIAARDAAILEANAIKATGAHMLSVGVGDAFGTSGSAVANRDALRRVSGNDAFDPDGAITGPEKPPFVVGEYDPKTTDLILEKQFSDLADTLRETALSFCEGTLKVKKEVSTPQAPDTYAPAAAWDFAAAPSAPGTSYNWVQGQTGATSTTNNPAVFQWDVTNVTAWDADNGVTVTEDLDPAYTMASVVCDKQPVAFNAQAGTFSVPVGSTGIVDCTVRNRANPLEGTLTLTKKVENGATGATTPATAWDLTATGPATITGKTGSGTVTNASVPAGDYTLSESGPGGYTGSWACIGGTLAAGKVTVANGANVSCEITNTAIAPKLTLVKVVANGPANPELWNLQAKDSAKEVVLEGDGGATGPVAIGTYSLHEEGGLEGYEYDLTGWVCSDKTGSTVSTTDSVTLELGDDITCTAVNAALPGLPKVKKTGPAKALAGDGKDYTYTVTVTNIGGMPLADSGFVDVVPEGLTVTGATSADAKCDIDAQTVTCALASDLAVDDSWTADITFTVPASYFADEYDSTVTNCAIYGVENTNDDVRLAALSSELPEYCWQTDIDKDVDLAVNKLGPAEALNGDEIFYAIAVRNLGVTDAAADANLADLVDEPFILASEPFDTPVGVECEATDDNAFECTIDNDLLKAGAEPVVFEVLVEVPDFAEAGDYDNWVVVGSDEDQAPCTLDPEVDAEFCNDEVESNNVDKTTTTIAPTTGLAIAKAANRGKGFVDSDDFFSSVGAQRGNTVTYRYAVTNTGNQPVDEVVLTDELNFGPSEGVAILPSPNEGDVKNCQVGNSDTPLDGFTGSTVTFGTPIEGLAIAPQQTAYIYCELLVPTSITDAQIELNAIYNRAKAAGSTEAGPVNATSNVVIVTIVVADVFPIKNLVDNDGTNPRKFETLGTLKAPVTKTFDLTVDNVSDTPLYFALYDYFSNESPGLTTAQRNAVFDGMKCIDYDNPGPTFPNPIAGPEFFKDLGPTNLTFGPGTGPVSQAGTYYTRGMILDANPATPAIDPIVPGDGYEILCSVTYPAGDYALTNVFRMVASPQPITSLTGGAAPAPVVGALPSFAQLAGAAAEAAFTPATLAQSVGSLFLAAADTATTGTYDLTAKAGVQSGTPPTDTEVLPAVIVKTGAAIGGLALLGMLLIGVGYTTRRLAQQKS